MQLDYRRDELLRHNGSCILGCSPVSKVINSLPSDFGNGIFMGVSIDPQRS